MASSTVKVLIIAIFIFCALFVIWQEYEDASIINATIVADYEQESMNVTSITSSKTAMIPSTTIEPPTKINIQNTPPTKAETAKAKPIKVKAKEAKKESIEQYFNKLLFDNDVDLISYFAQANDYIPLYNMDSFRRSRPVVGDVTRLQRLLHKLIYKKQCINTLRIGGSITQGHAVGRDKGWPYQFKYWLNHYHNFLFFLINIIDY